MKTLLASEAFFRALCFAAACALTRRKAALRAEFIQTFHKEFNTQLSKDKKSLGREVGIIDLPKTSRRPIKDVSSVFYRQFQMFLFSFEH